MANRKNSFYSVKLCVSGRKLRLEYKFDELEEMKMDNNEVLAEFDFQTNNS